ncbi:MAG: sigma-54-dependent Fis family transcriptional regulator [Nitrospirae bacterium]|nr:MAG: sigma-54-dependent Fis family transcriptional regulator [Nitrospirota bacterium]
MAEARVLLVDDDRNLREVTRVGLSRHGFEVVAAASGEEGLAAAEAEAFDVVVTDLRMPGMGGMTLLRRLQERQPGLPVIVLTAYGSIEAAVAAMKAGAVDFATKPVDLEALALLVQRAAEHSRLRQENAQLRAQVAAGGGHPGLVVASEAMERLLETVRQVAPSPATVLLTGESGTGKELVARALHEASGRTGPFVAVNCAALPGELLESELFGHEAGAFTGAAGPRPGRIRAAAGGTLLLDEIGEMAPAAQAKLLRFLEGGEVDPVGASRPVAVDARVVAATNVELAERVREGGFREDLYYRLNVVPLRVPPLRERREEISVLARHFLAAFAEGRELALAPEAEAALVAHHWPGNVRELKNLCRRLALLVRGAEVRLADLPPEIAGASAATLPEMEREAVVRALAAHDWNQSAAARALGVPRHVLVYRMKKYGITREQG